MVACFGLTPPLVTTSPLLHRFGVYLPHDLEEWQPSIPTRHQAVLQPLDELLVLLPCHSALLHGLLLRYLVALVGRFIAVPMKRVLAREVFAASIAEVDHQWVRLRGVAVPLELLEVLDLRTWADTALDCLDCPTRGIGL